jgi:16S rRNA (cytosine1402-N4)-methyltransferase
MDQTTPSPKPAYHEPVMVAEVLDVLGPAANGVVVDGTYGGGGHSAALLERYPQMRIVAIDRDPEAVRTAVGRSGSRLSVVEGNFVRVAEVLADELGPESGTGSSVDGVLLDLGVSSHQLDTAERGFSYHRAGPLDMRMGPDAARSAADVVNEWSVADLAAAFKRYGEERYARRIAEAIVRNRPLSDTAELSSVIAAAVPAPARRARHPARRVFQAIRIAVNEELAALERGLDAAIDVLRPGGRLVVIAYHSLEDRIVKQRFVAGSATCVCPPDLPVCGCGRTAELRLITRRALRPGDEEIARNPRSRSAVLRAAEKVAS